VGDTCHSCMLHGREGGTGCCFVGVAWRGVAFLELEVKNEKSIARQEQNKNEL